MLGLDVNSRGVEIRRGSIPPPWRGCAAWFRFLQKSRVHRLFVITHQHGRFLQMTPQKLLPFWDSSIRPRQNKRLRSELVVPNLTKNEKERLRSEFVVPHLKKQMKKTTLDSRAIVCVRERTAKPAFSSNDKNLTRSVGRSVAVAQI